MVYLNPGVSSLVWTFLDRTKYQDLLAWTPRLQGCFRHVLQGTLLYDFHQDIFTILAQKVNKMYEWPCRSQNNGWSIQYKKFCFSDFAFPVFIVRSEGG